MALYGLPFQSRLMQSMNSSNELKKTAIPNVSYKGTDNGIKSPKRLAFGYGLSTQIKTVNALAWPQGLGG